MRKIQLLSPAHWLQWSKVTTWWRGGKKWTDLDLWRGSGSSLSITKTWSKISNEWFQDNWLKGSSSNVCGVIWKWLCTDTFSSNQIFQRGTWETFILLFFGGKREDRKKIKSLRTQCDTPQNNWIIESTFNLIHIESFPFIVCLGMSSPMPASVVTAWPSSDRLLIFQQSSGFGIGYISTAFLTEQWTCWAIPNEVVKAFCILKTPPEFQQARLYNSWLTNTKHFTFVICSL